ncbi:MAG: hypothetical protein WCB90_07160 [Methanosarcina sp.]
MQGFVREGLEEKKLGAEGYQEIRHMCVVMWDRRTAPPFHNYPRIRAATRDCSSHVVSI